MQNEATGTHNPDSPDYDVAEAHKRLWPEEKTRGSAFGPASEPKAPVTTATTSKEIR